MERYLFVSALQIALSHLAMFGFAIDARYKLRRNSFVTVFLKNGQRLPRRGRTMKWAMLTLEAVSKYPTVGSPT